MNPLLFNLIPTVLDKFFPDPAEKQRFQTQLAQMDSKEREETLNFLAKLNEGQTQINLEDAKNKESLLNRGWRPYLCWGLVTAALWTVLGYPIASFLWPLFDITTTQLINGAIVQVPLEISPPISSAFVEELLIALLGLNGMRSYDKKIGIAS